MSATYSSRYIIAMILELGPALRSARRAMEALEMKDREAEQLRKVPVTILTGFLGSGKTTLLNFVLKARHGYKYAIIENEVGRSESITSC